jgi:hypothetical protein
VHDDAIDEFLQQLNMHDMTAPFLPDDPPPPINADSTKSTTSGALRAS